MLFCFTTVDLLLPTHECDVSYSPFGSPITHTHTGMYTRTQPLSTEEVPYSPSLLRGFITGSGFLHASSTYIAMIMFVCFLFHNMVCFIN